MKKKYVFLQMRAGSICMLLGFNAIIIVITYYAIMNIINYPDKQIIDNILIIIVTIVLGLGILLKEFSYYIKIENGTIKTKGHFLERSFYKSQFPLTISIDEIVNIRLLISKRNSLKGESTYSPSLYMEIGLTDGKIVWLNIQGFSEKQRLHIFQIINEQLGSHYDYKALKEKANWEF